MNTEPLPAEDFLNPPINFTIGEKVHLCFNANEGIGLVGTIQYIDKERNEAIISVPNRSGPRVIRGHIRFLSKLH